MAASYTWNFGSDDADVHFTVVYDIESNKFFVEVHKGSFDLNALWWGGEEASGDTKVAVAKGDNSVNMNGDTTVWDDDGNATSQKIDWDGYAKFSDPGLGKAGESKTTFVSETDKEPAEFGGGAFGAYLLTLKDGAEPTLGVRATSVGGEGGGSFKFADTDPEYDDGNGGNNPANDFPEWAQDISNIVLIFDQTEGDTKPRSDGDGYYTVKIDVPTSMDDDLDNVINKIINKLIAEDENIDASSDLLGVVIKGGNQNTEYYSYGVHNTNGVSSDALPVGIGFDLPGDKGNVDPVNAIDATYDWAGLVL